VVGRSGVAVPTGSVVLNRHALGAPVTGTPCILSPCWSPVGMRWYTRIRGALRSAPCILVVCFVLAVFFAGPRSPWAPVKDDDLRRAGRERSPG
jgi:hypothetical protein